LTEQYREATIGRSVERRCLLPASCFLLLAPSAALAQTVSDEEIRVRQADLKIEKFYVDQNHYYYVLPEDLETPEFLREGSLLWRYDGQQEFSDSELDLPVRQQITMREPDYVLTGIEFDPEAYLGVGLMGRLDQYGRRWVLDSVDLETLRHLIEAYDEKVRAMYGKEEEGIDAGVGIEYNDAAGEEYSGIPTGWDKIDCPPSDFHFEHNGNGYLTKAPAPLNDRSKLVVGNGASGTLVGDDRVLTAAHTWTYANGSPRDLLTIPPYCTLENLVENLASGPPWCYGVEHFYPSPNWKGYPESPTDTVYSTVDEDYAVVDILGAPGAVLGTMPLSQASDSTISSAVDRHRGVPDFTRACSLNTISDDALTYDDYHNGFHLFQADGTVQSTPTGYVKYDTSTATGCSGGPHYYCPTGACVTVFITGVQGIASICDNPPCTSGYVAGPKARDIRDFVISRL
jgi:hypothetical protein